MKEENGYDQINFGIIPIGTRNSLACTLNGNNINETIFNIIKGKTIKSDLIKAKAD